MDEPKVEPKVEVPVKTPVQKLQEFLDKEGLAITATPAFVPSGRGAFVVEVSVGVQKKEVV